MLSGYDGDDTFILGDDGADGQKITATIDGSIKRLDTTAKLAENNENSQGVHCYSPSYFCYVENDTSAPVSIGTTYTTLYSLNDTGKFVGLSLDFDGNFNANNDVQVKLELDGNIIFEQKIHELDLFQFKEASSNRVLNSGGPIASTSKLFFTPIHAPIRFYSSATVQALRIGSAKNLIFLRINLDLT